MSKNHSAVTSAVEWLDKNWLEYITYFPSQLYRRFNLRGIEYTVYLRWRYDDPWQCMIAEGLSPNKTKIIRLHDKVKPKYWSDDLFLENHDWFGSGEYKKAEKRAEEIAVEWAESEFMETG